MSGRAELTRQLAQGLIAELHSAEADLRIALLLGRVELAHGQYRLSVALRVERHSDMEARGVFVLVGAVLDLDQPRRFHPQEHHAVVVTRAVGPRVDEAPAPAGADVALQRFNLESVGPEPLHDLLRVGPCLEDALARCGDHTAQHDLAIERPGSAGVSVHGRYLSSRSLRGIVPDGRSAPPRRRGWGRTSGRPRRDARQSADTDASARRVRAR